MSEFKIVREMADAEFDRFTDMMDIDVDQSGMDSEDEDEMLKSKNRIVRAIQKGDLVIDDDGQAVYTPSNVNSKYDKPLVFHEQSGAAIIASDKSKKGQNMRATFAIMGEMCKVHPNVFVGLYGSDIKTCMAIFMLLMD